MSEPQFKPKFISLESVFANQMLVKKLTAAIDEMAEVQKSITRLKLQHHFIQTQACQKLGISKKQFDMLVQLQMSELA